MKRCYLCRTEQPYTNFYTDRTRKDGRSSKCKSCARTYVKKNIDPNRTHKRCSKCKNELPLECFAKSKLHDGYQSACRTCRSMIPYDINPEQYASLVLAQNGKCAICEQGEKLVIDHDHTTGKVRGLLCVKCNWGLGHFEDKTDRLLAAAKYLG